MPEIPFHTYRISFIYWLLLITLPAFLTSCTPTQGILDSVTGDRQQPAPGARAYSIYLVGDAGASYTDTPKTALPLLKKMLEAESFNSTVVFMGDNIYPSGMPGLEAADRPLREHLIDQQLATVEEHTGQVVFVPGNHDWGGQGLGGDRDALRRQELYVEDKLDRGNTFLPDKGFPGPVEVALNNEITLVVLDTQWWLEPDRPYGDTELYEIDQVGRVLVELEDVFKRNAGKHIVVVGHHPLLSDGSHGGHFNMALSPVSLMRRYMGTPQDFSNFGYRRLRKALLGVFDKYPGLIYGAGHDHSLQYLIRNEQHYIVSGAGSKTGYVKEGGDAEFAYSDHGFARLIFYTDGSVWLEFWLTTGKATNEGKRVYARLIKPGNRALVPFEPQKTIAGKAITPEETLVVSGEKEDKDPAEPSESVDPALGEEPYVFASKGTMTVVPGEYDIPRVLRGWLGRRYRSIWSSEVEVPVIDLERTAGGLTPVKKGGGFQSTTLRLQGGDGDQYVLRSVNKDASAVLPGFLKNTLVDDYVEDVTSGMHPYGAFVVPQLADAAGIYHTEPRLVVIPDDEQLGIYREEMAGVLALFEMRPDDEQLDEARFGRPENIIGSDRMFEKMLERNEHRVDAAFMARARLFDMFLGDWDRHKDQWRWAVFEPYEVDPTLTGRERTRGKVYRPIPRDRDFVFFKPEGIISDVARAIGGHQVRTSEFGPEITHLKGLNYNASDLDFRFLSPLSRADWLTIAEELRANLTDEVIEAAINQMPESGFVESGHDLIENLKQRREQLPEVADTYYHLLARQVDIIGSDESEEFYVEHVDENTVRVRMFKLSRIGVRERVLFSRLFYAGETREVHLYGLGGVDRFVFEGAADSGITVRAVGGYGVDTFEGGGEGNVVYDTPRSNVYNVHPRTKIRANAVPRANTYTGHRFKPGALSPAFGYALNNEDKVFLGTGVKLTDTGFLNAPYRSQHTVLFRQSLFTRAFIASYKGHFPASFGTWDSHIRTEYYGNNNIRNFYGFGNNSDGSQENRRRFRAQYSQLIVEPKLTTRFTFFRSLEAGIRLEYTNIDPIPGGISGGELGSGYSADDMKEKLYAGLALSYSIDGTDSSTVTHSGARWVNTILLNQGIYNTSRRYLAVSSELSYFYPITALGDVSFAFRVGGARHFGAFEFYQANVISGRTNVRGYEKNRFAGHSSFYNNYELRARLFNYNVYVFTGQVGILGFFDHGRVWSDVENETMWHAGYGGGVWVVPLQSIVINATYGFTREGQLLDFFLRFLF